MMRVSCVRGIRGRLRTERGLTLVEVSIILTMTLTIMGALAPTLSVVIRHAETTAATSAMTDLSTQVLQALTDMGFTYYTINGQSSGTQVQRLVSDGDIPREVSGTGSATWQSAVDNTTGLTDFLERHLIFNAPRGSAANAYSIIEDAFEHYWRGSYLTNPLDPDPWGNRYAVNVEFLGASTNDVVVFSAGPDEEIDTAYTAVSLAAGDDDLIVLVEA